MEILTFDEWAEKFQPIPNTIDKNASFSGYAKDDAGNEIDAGILFETFGAELAQVTQVADVSPRCVWTLKDDEELSPPDHALALVDMHKVTEEESDNGEHNEGDIIDSDGERVDCSNASSGMHSVNRLGYFLTRIPAENNVDYLILDDTLADAYRLSAANDRDVVPSPQP